MVDIRLVCVIEHKIPVTVVVSVKNEARNISACLSKLQDFQEIIVIDSDSTDGTRKIVENAGVRIIDFKWNGGYPKKRNWYLINNKPACEWVFFLDADEYVTKSACKAINLAVKSTKYNGYWLNYNNHFLGKRLRFGVPQRKLALFRVGKGLYERIEENHWSDLDMEVHEHPIIEGRVGEITEPIEHNDDRGIDRFVERHRRYALWEASRIESLDNTKNGLTRRQRFKYGSVSRWWFPWFYLFYTYFIRLGFLDGKSGFCYAFYKAWYFLTIQLIINERYRQKKSKI